MKNMLRSTGRILLFAALDFLVFVALASAQEAVQPKTITFIRVYNGVVYRVNLEDQKDWIAKWVKKNTKKFPNVHFADSAESNTQNFVVVLTANDSSLSGFQPVTRTDYSTTPVSGSGGVITNQGNVWFYTFNGNVTTTTTYTANVPYTINETGLYATAYNSNGRIVGRESHVYSTQSGGDPYNSLGYNGMSALMAINARGRLLHAIVLDVCPKNKKSKK